VSARLEAPTDRYDHGVLGDTTEHGTLAVTMADGRVLRAVLPETRVFEDTGPRLADMDGDGAPEIVVVESDQGLGSRLTVWAADDALRLRAATPFIGERFRWIAPVAVADLDGDGTVEIAAVDRPHLARVLRVWRFDAGRLVPVAAASGLTNHRIGETDIAGGLRDCGAGPEMVLATEDWRRLVAVRLRDGALAARDIGPHRDRASFAGALACR
jgi:hypothetical protein